MGSTDISRPPSKLSTYKHKHLQTQTTLQKSIIMKGECGCSGTSSCNCGSSCSCSSCGKEISITYIPLSHAPSILLLSCGRSHDSTRNLISLPSLGFSDLGWRDIVLGMD